MRTLKEELGGWLGQAGRKLQGFEPGPRFDQVGRVERVGDGVAVVSGLPDARTDELLLFTGDVMGMAVSLDRQEIGCLLLGADSGIAAGHEVRATGAVARVPAGDALLGRIVDPLGRPLDEGGEIDADRMDPIERPAPAVVERDLVTEPLETGITLIDAMLPLGRGQRELIIGDRSIGKSAIAVDTMINQRRSDVICVYAAVGQKSSSVNRVIGALRDNGAFERCVFVVGAADDAPGVQWLAPYSACTIAEHFSRSGRHALLVIDDLTKHAAIYRQLSLLLRYPPGREAYPGDIFYTHARLLERAAKLNAEQGGGSLTALPIAETQAGNLSAYIPTNLISITDGQIYLEPKLFYEGQKPAISVGKSVSRVGAKTQAPLIRDLAKSLRLEYAQFLELEVFTRFGGMLDARTERTIRHGRRIRAVLTQRQYAPLSPGEQVALLLAVTERVMDDVALEATEDFKAAVLDWFAGDGASMRDRIDAEAALSDADRETLLARLREIAAGLPRDPAVERAEAAAAARAEAGGDAAG